MDETQKQWTKRKKPDAKGYILLRDYIYIKCSGKNKERKPFSIQWTLKRMPRAEGGSRTITKGIPGNFWGDEGNILKLVCGDGCTTL